MQTQPNETNAWFRLPFMHDSGLDVLPTSITAIQK